MHRYVKTFKCQAHARAWLRLVYVNRLRFLDMFPRLSVLDMRPGVAYSYTLRVKEPHMTLVTIQPDLEFLDPDFHCMQIEEFENGTGLDVTLTDSGAPDVEDPFY